MWAIGIAMTVMAAIMLVVVALRPADEADFSAQRSSRMAETLATELNTVHQAAVRFAFDNPTARTLTSNDLRNATPPAGGTYLPDYYVSPPPAPAGATASYPFRATWQADILVQGTPQTVQVVTYMPQPDELIPLRVVPQELANALAEITGDPVTSGFARNLGGVLVIDAGLRGVGANASDRIAVPSGTAPEGAPLRYSSLGPVTNSIGARTPFVRIDPPPAADQRLTAFGSASELTGAAGTLRYDASTLPDPAPVPGGGG